MALLNEHAYSYQNGKIHEIIVISEAHAQHYLKECQGIKLQNVQVLIPTTSMLNVHCKVELLELHLSDNREEVLQQEGIHMRNMTPHHQENSVVPLMSM